MSPRERDEQFLDNYLEGDSELSRLYRRGAEQQPEAQPGAQLDARIRAEARRAVASGARARVVHSPFARHWMVPTSLAAVCVLSLGVVLLMPEPDGEPGSVSEQPREAAQPARSDSAPRDVQGDVRSEVRGNAQGDASRLQQAPAPSSAAASVKSDTRSQQPAKSEEKRKALRSEQQDADREALQAAPRPAASLAEEAAAAAPDAPSPAAALTFRPSASKPVRDDPRAWLRHIEALLDAHRQAQASSDLRAFVRRYPDVPLPERLADLAASMNGPPP